MVFYAGRISLLPIYNSLFYNYGNEKRFDKVIELLSTKKEINVRKGTTIIIEPIFDEKDKLIGGKIGRTSRTRLPLRNEGILEKIPTQIYPYILFALIEDEQVILFEKNSQVFNNELAVFKYILDFLNKDLFYLGLEVDMKPLTVKGEFWNLINSMDKVYTIRFLLKAPNFLGKTYKDLSDILGEEKENSNANQVEYGISNYKGELRIVDKDKYAAAVGWIEDGGGEWGLKAKPRERGAKKRHFKSTQQLTYFEVEREPEIEDLVFIKKVHINIDIGRHRAIKGE